MLLEYKISKTDRLIDLLIDCLVLMGKFNIAPNIPADTWACCMFLAQGCRAEITFFRNVFVQVTAM